MAFHCSLNNGQQQNRAPTRMNYIVHTSNIAFREFWTEENTILKSKFDHITITSKHGQRDLLLQLIFRNLFFSLLQMYSSCTQSGRMQRDTKKQIPANIALYRIFDFTYLRPVQLTLLEQLRILHRQQIQWVAVILANSRYFGHRWSTES